jgi:hypothetical protein
MESSLFHLGYGVLEGVISFPRIVPYDHMKCDMLQKALNYIHYTNDASKDMNAFLILPKISTDLYLSFCMRYLRSAKTKMELR